MCCCVLRLLCAQVLVLEPCEEAPELDFQQPHRTLEATELVQLPKHKAALFDQFARAQVTAHSTQHTAHSTQHTAHSTQHTAQY